MAEQSSTEEVIHWRCTFANTILDVLNQKPNWLPSSNPTDWDLLWCGKDWMNNHFDRHTFNTKQKVSHFRNDQELTRKDSLVRNVKKIRRQLDKEGKIEEAKRYDFLPASYILPFQPLKAWVHRDGFVRFSHARYSVASIEDAYVHLTNVAIAKTAPDYDPERGLKWPFLKFRRYLAAKLGQATVLKLLDDIGWILVRSLRSVQRQIIQDKHCFELYGYDILLDKNIKPWLLEVNASPSLTASSQEDYTMKFRVLNHTLDVVDPAGRLTGVERRVGGFDMLINGDTVDLQLPHSSEQDHKAYKSRLNVHIGAEY